MFCYFVIMSNVTSLCCNNFAKKIFRVGKLSTTKINGGVKVKASYIYVLLNFQLILLFIRWPNHNINMQIFL